MRRAFWDKALRCMSGARRYHMHALKGNELPPEVEYLILLLNGYSGN